MAFTQELARRIAAMTFESLPKDAVYWAKIGILDTIGVTLAGAGEDCTRIVGRVFPESHGASLLFGTRRTVSALDAATINGTASHALDFDDCSNTLGGHPSTPLLAAMFALADTMTVSGRDFVAAYVTGFETECRFARAVNFHHYEKGWHPTATLGVFGAAASACHLLRLSEEKTATALSLAASFASGIKANFGTMTKPLHVGHCNRNGLLAALLAREGITSAPDALEHRQGFFHVYNGAGNFDAEALLRNWASPLDILEPGLAIKQYPCCGSTHPAIDATIGLVREHGLDPSQVARVDTLIHARRLAHTNRPEPKSSLDAKFSLQYCVARALAEGKVVLEHFEGDAYTDPGIVDLLTRIHAAPHPDMPMSTTEHFGGEVRVMTRDGRLLAKRVEEPLGRSPDYPLPLPLLEAKFRNCAERALDPVAARRLLALLWEIDGIEDLSLLRQCLIDGVRENA